jgi:CheY-like chemotaxis protein
MISSASPGDKLYYNFPMAAPSIPELDFRHSILVVDDDPQVRKLFSQVLNKAGYSVYDACDGLQAKSFIQRIQFDLIILDLNMPEMDGFEVLKFARSELPFLKIIVVSGFMQGTMLKAAKLFGAAATLDKPVQMSLLLSTVRDVMAG